MQNVSGVCMGVIGTYVGYTPLEEGLHLCSFCAALTRCARRLECIFAGAMDCGSSPLHPHTQWFIAYSTTADWAASPDLRALLKSPASQTNVDFRTRFFACLQFFQLCFLSTAL